MRGSGTEPVFRIMADVEGANLHLHDSLLEWHRAMLTEADNQ
jgi:phosphomannomutase